MTKSSNSASAFGFSAVGEVGALHVGEGGVHFVVLGGLRRDLGRPQHGAVIGSLGAQDGPRGGLLVAQVLQGLDVVGGSQSGLQTDAGVVESGAGCTDGGARIGQGQDLFSGIQGRLGLGGRGIVRRFRGDGVDFILHRGDGLEQVAAPVQSESAALHPGVRGLAARSRLDWRRLCRGLALVS